MAQHYSMHIYCLSDLSLPLLMVQTAQTVPVVVTQPVEMGPQFRDYPVIIVDSKGQQVWDHCAT